jgi:hypothetical protein
MMASFIDRMVGAAKLDVKTYEEVEADSGALGQLSPLSCSRASRLAWEAAKGGSLSERLGRSSHG